MILGLIMSVMFIGACGACAFLMLCGARSDVEAKQSLLPDHDPGADVARFATGLPAGSTLGALAQPWTRWDGAHFLTLARDGYVESAAAAAVGCYCYP